MDTGVFALALENFDKKYRIPPGKKSTIVEPPNLATNEEKIDFFRGWFAGDGSVTVDRKRPRLELWSKSRKLLKWFREVLEQNGIESRIFYHKRKDQYLLSIGRIGDVINFYEKIVIPHPEKQEKLKFLVSRFLPPAI